jgi:hypothetical protein
MCTGGTTWNERNLLAESRDNRQAVWYRYGADGERALKYAAGSGDQTLYYTTQRAKFQEAYKLIETNRGAEILEKLIGLVR